VNNEEKILRATILMMVALLLPLLWNMIPISIIWAFPFFDAKCQCFSWSPVEYRSYPIQTIAPLYFSFGVVPIYIYCRGLVQEMKVWNIDLWVFHLAFYAIQAFDIFLAFSQIPYYRTFFVFVGITLHIKYLLDNNR